MDWPCQNLAILLLFEYTWGILKEKGCQEKGCRLYRINGIEDHIHIATHIHPTVALASLIKDIKLATSSYVKANNIFRSFTGWQDGYAA
ncbi:MAG: transposase [Cyclobacteriaceae bacterium]